MNDFLNLIAGKAGPTEWKIALILWFGFMFILLPLGAIKEWQKNPKNPDKGKIFGLLAWPILTAVVIIYLILTQGKGNPGFPIMKIELLP